MARIKCVIVGHRDPPTAPAAVLLLKQYIRNDPGTLLLDEVKSVTIRNLDEEPSDAICDNCQAIFSMEHMDLWSIKDLAERLDPGAEVPAGECPKCGALCYVL